MDFGIQWFLSLSSLIYESNVSAMYFLPQPHPSNFLHLVKCGDPFRIWFFGVATELICEIVFGFFLIVLKMWTTILMTIFLVLITEQSSFSFDIIRSKIAHKKEPRSIIIIYCVKGILISSFIICVQQHLFSW